MNHIVAGSGVQGCSGEQIPRIPTCSSWGASVTEAERPVQPGGMSYHVCSLWL